MRPSAWRNIKWSTVNLTALLNFSRWTLGAVRWLSLAALSSIGFAMDVDLGREQLEFVKPPIEFVQAHAAEMGGILGSVFVGLSVVVWVIDSRTQTREQRIIALLADAEMETFRSSVFPEIPDHEPQDHNRVTLFLHHPCAFWVTPFRSTLWPWGLWRHPWSGWLIIAHRSGHLTQSSTTAFLAPDDAAHAEGVAGEAWRSGAVRVKGLPDLSGTEYISHIRAARAWTLRHFGYDTEWKRCLQHYAAVRSYAKSTNCLETFVWARLKKRKPCPTTILGVLVPNSRGQPSGVLVMDSCNAHDCIDTKELKFKRALKELTKKLQGYGVLD